MEKKTLGRRLFGRFKGEEKNQKVGAVFGGLFGRGKKKTKGGGLLCFFG